MNAHVLKKNIFIGIGNIYLARCVKNNDFSHNESITAIDFKRIGFIKLFLFIKFILPFISSNKGLGASFFIPLSSFF